MQAVMDILRKENKVKFMYGRYKFYNIVRKKFHTARRRWKQNVCMRNFPLSTFHFPLSSFNNLDRVAHKVRCWMWTYMALHVRE